MGFFQEHVNFCPPLSHSLLWFIFLWGFCNHRKTEKLQYLLKIDTDRYLLRRFSAYKSFLSSMVFKNHRSGPLAPDPSVKMRVFEYWLLKVFWVCGRLTVLVLTKNLICLDNSIVLRAECPVKGFHNVWSCKWPWYFQQGLSLTPAAVACLLIPPKSESVLSHSTFQILSGLFSYKSNYGLKQRACDVTVLFLAMVLGKKNTSLCLVSRVEPVHTQSSAGLSQRDFCVPIAVLSGTKWLFQIICSKSFWKLNATLYFSSEKKCYFICINRKISMRTLESILPKFLSTVSI